MTVLRSMLKPLAFGATAASLCAVVYEPPRHDELLTRMPEAPPYLTSEARFFPPPFEDYWKTVDNPASCESCHRRIFEEWNGSMMANAWRDPVWRGAFLLAARATSTRGDCDVPAPPDGTRQARHNPFASAVTCASTFDLGGARQTLARPGSLLDGFCSRCHMPTNYVDNVPLRDVERDGPSGREHGRLDPDFDPTSDAGTGLAFATVEARFRNTDSGKSGVSCAVCHSIAETRDTPFHGLPRAESPGQPGYVPALGAEARSRIVPEDARDTFDVPDGSGASLGLAVGSGSFRLSPHAIGFPERFGPLASTAGHGGEPYLEGVFKRPMPYEQADGSKHGAYRHVLLTRAEVCGACHDVTNPLPIKNALGRWVGGFPIERTYAEWQRSRYADRPGNPYFDPAYKRDCQTCHMQQDYGQPGTAQTLYERGAPRPPLRDRLTSDTASRPYFSHHFVGGNAYLPRLIGSDVTTLGTVEPYPELSNFSFTSSDPASPYANAYWTGADKRGALVQQARLAWDRLRNVVDLDLAAPATAAPGQRVPLTLRVTNSGSGHKFPTGFPEGRVAWVSVRAFDLGSGTELEIHDSVWNRDSRGVGRLTTAETADPNFARCDWRLPAGSPDPYAVQFKAVASLGDGCPTLELVYAAPLNLVVDALGRPLDGAGRVVDRSAPDARPQFKDLDGDGDVYDDAFLRDTRLDPLPLPGASVALDRYSVVVPADADGPIAVTAAVYYQSVEAVVALKFLGNLADTNGDARLEPCVLGGPCDGRTPSGEPAVVEGAPPVPMRVRSSVIRLGAARPRAAPRPSVAPAADATGVARDVVVKASFREPVSGLDAATFTLRDGHGAPVPASVAQIDDGTWALFPDAVFLHGGETYTVQIAAGVCGVAGNCTTAPSRWRFHTVLAKGEGTGALHASADFDRGSGRPAPPPRVIAADAEDGRIVVRFSAPVMNVTSGTLHVALAAASGCPSEDSVPGRVVAGADADVWSYVPAAPLDDSATYCVRVGRDVYDMAGRSLRQPFESVAGRTPSRPSRR